jgi:hypothetical protein
VCLKSTDSTCVHYTKQKGVAAPNEDHNPYTCINLRRSFALVTSDSSGAETTGTPIRIIQLFNFCDFTDSSIRRKYYLCNAITFVDMETFVHGTIFELDQDHPYLATIRRIDSPRRVQHSDAMLQTLGRCEVGSAPQPQTAAQRPAPS